MICIEMRELKTGAGRMALETQTELEIVPSREAVAKVTAEIAAEAEAATVNAAVESSTLTESSTITDEQLETGLELPDSPSAEMLAGIYLLELADVLDQHR